MKKCLCIFVCVFLCFMSACCSGNDAIGSSLSEIKMHQSVKREIVDSGKYYCIYKSDTSSFDYVIYNADGKVALSETTDNPISINMLNADIVDIGIGMGTGLSIHRYYSVEKDSFSNEFSYVLSNYGERIAYLYVPDMNSFEDRKVVVQNMFNQKLYYNEFTLEFSNIDTPVIKAVFLDNGTSLQLTYLSGENQTQITKTLEL